MPHPKIEIYDTTLRDGAQMHGISFSLADKLKIVSLLDEMGVDIVEGGWPGANPKDGQFFEEVGKLSLCNSSIAAFGSTKRLDSVDCRNDPIMQGLLRAKTDTVTIVGKAWDLHVEVALRTTLEKNVEMIAESVAYLVEQGKRVIFDAEHFFDGYRNNAAYAKRVLRVALESGATTLCLCDTNGGSLPSWIDSAVRDLASEIPVEKLGIHAHNDGGLALANTLSAVEAGVQHVQGTINGYGERCGNVDLLSVICNLQLKMERRTLPSRDHLKNVTRVSHFVGEIANFNANPQQPFVGQFAFAHKGGLHASAMQRDRRTYEAIEPEAVGNRSRSIVSEQSGISNILGFAKTHNIDLGASQQTIAKAILTDIKERESQGYQFEQADASLLLLILEHLEARPKYFDVVDFRVLVTSDELAEATVQVRVQDKLMHMASLGVGPGHALDNALRKALNTYYAESQAFKLTDFKVRVVDSHDGTAAKTRVNVEMDYHGRKWNTVGVHNNIVQATFEAITQSVEYGLYLTENLVAQNS